MAEETLLTAARRVIRFFDIDMNNGGLMTTDTLIAMDTLRKRVSGAVRDIKEHGKLEITEDYGNGDKSG